MQNLEAAMTLLRSGGLIVDADKGVVYSTRSCSGKDVNDTKNRIRLKTVVDKKSGYEMLGFKYLGIKYLISVHKLVWLSVNGMYEDGFTVVHKDYCRSNNFIKNLALISRAQQMSDKKWWRYSENLPKGELNNKAKLSDDEVNIIRFMNSVAGLSCQRLSVDFGVSRMHIWRLCKNVSRKVATPVAKTKFTYSNIYFVNLENEYANISWESCLPFGG